MHNRKQKIFFSGIAGSGMSAIAHFIADRGHTVAGSDRSFDSDPESPLRQTFLLKGVEIMPQDGSGIDRSFDFAVFSTAVEPDHPEMLKARSLGIPVKTRSDYLSEISMHFRTIAIAGTSGKSTTAGLLAYLMQQLGLNPNYIGGGRVKQFETPMNPGNSLTGSSEHLVIEACESDGSVANFRPHYAIILNIAFDHHPINETEKMFLQLAKNTEKRIIVNGDDSGLSGIRDEKTLMFSIKQDSPYRAVNIHDKQYETEFSVNTTKFRLSLPGKHNVYNALSCIALLTELDISLTEIARFLPHFNGIGRRFDIKLNNGKHIVIDDYAHNPHKIHALMSTVQSLSDHICFIFQPHGFAPTRLMRNEYIEVFSDTLRGPDHLILLPIYYAGGSITRDITSEDLAQEISARGKSAEAVEKRDHVFKKLDSFNAYVIFGARDDSLSDFSRQIADALG